MALYVTAYRVRGIGGTWDKGSESIGGLGGRYEANTQRSRGSSKKKIESGPVSGVICRLSAVKSS